MTAFRKPKEVLVVIGSSATSESNFDSPGRLQEVSINHIDYETCNDPVDFVIICAGVPVAGEERCQSNSVVLIDRG
jgi:hypothetical protein